MIWHNFVLVPVYIHHPPEVVMDFDERVSSFEYSCHLYRNELEEAEKLRKQNLDLLGKKTLSILESDIQYVDETFEIIKEKCGHHAAVLMWHLYVEEKKGEEVADKFNISRTTLTTWVKKWKQKLFGEE